MKKLVFLMLVLLGSVPISAEGNTINPNRYFFTYSYDNAVYFIERGIEFNVFINGDFDFSTRRNNRFRNFRNARIVRDFDGRIRRIGNVNIRYDRRGNVRRIGSVRMTYFRGRLSRVGNLRVRYDRWGYPLFYGNVNSFRDNRFNGNVGNIYYFNDPFFSNRNFSRNYVRFREDRNFIYYRAKRNARVNDNNRVIKRRKGETRKRNSNFKREDSYRKSEIRRTPNRSTNRRR